MPKDGTVLLVGSVPANDADEVFRLLASGLGDRAPRYPDGETGERRNWIRWQHHVFADNPALELIDPATKLAGYADTLARPFFAIRSGVDPRSIRFKPLGYADQAIRSYDVFSRLQREGVIPASTRFQVSIPTVVDLLSGFVLVSDRGRLEPALEEAMHAEVASILAAIPHQQLAIQWDFCQEVVGYDGGYDLHYDNILENSVERLCRLADPIPSAVEVGVHLCYGDPGHKHVVEPEDAGTCVKFVNAILASSGRRIDWIHLPIPRNWREARFYEPLKGLSPIGETTLFLGLVHYTDGENGTKERIELARRFLPAFGAATECGFGRRDPGTIPGLLAIHRAASEATAA